MGARRILLLVAAAIVALVGVACLATGVATLVAVATDRDGDGYFSTSTERFRTDGHALAADRVDLGEHPAGIDGEGFERLRVRVVATPADGAALFVGVGPQPEVWAYLEGVAHDRIADVVFGRSEVRYERRTGSVAPGRPAAERFWVERSVGTGPRTLEWDLRDGDWALVVMNADARRVVAADVRVGEAWSDVIGMGIGLIASGALLLGAGGFMGFRAVRRRPPAGEPEPQPGPEAPAPPAFRGRGTPAPTPGAAIVALSMGVVGLIAVPLLPSIAAVVLGRRASRRIDATAEPIGGRGVATAGMVLGWAGIALCPLLGVLLVLVLGPGG